MFNVVNLIIKRDDEISCCLTKSRGGIECITFSYTTRIPHTRLVAPTAANAENN